MTFAAVSVVLGENPLTRALNLLLFGSHGESQTELGRTADSTLRFIFLVSAFFFVLLMTLMVVFVIRFRRRPGVAAPRSASHNTPLELAWSIVPLILLVIMFFMGFRGYMRAQVAPSTAEQITVKAQRWSWSVTYANGASSLERERLGYEVDRDSYIVEAPVFYVPAARPVKLRMYSIDVIHSFWVPDFRVKFDVFPNRYTSLWFQTDPLDQGEGVKEKINPATGQVLFPYRDHYVKCAEYCGEGHSQMLAILRAVPEDVYRAKIEEWAVTGGTPAERGLKVATGKGGCFACHTTDGTVKIGPSWLGLFGEEQTFTDGSTQVVDENYIRESILNPAAKIVAGFPNQMTPYKGVLTNDEIDWIIEYIRSLSEAGAGEAGQTPGTGAEGGADAAAEQGGADSNAGGGGGGGG